MSAISLFEEKQVRRAWNASEQKWVFAIVDVIAILTDSVDSGAYWRKLKQRLKKEGNETVMNCHGLKMTAADGKQRLTDVADTEQQLRLIQSVPSPKAEPFKRWLAKVGYERLEEIENPELAAKRMRAIYEGKGYSEDWIENNLVHHLIMQVSPFSKSEFDTMRLNSYLLLRLRATDQLPSAFRKFTETCGGRAIRADKNKLAGISLLALDVLMSICRTLSFSTSFEASMSLVGSPMEADELLGNILGLIAHSGQTFPIVQLPDMRLASIEGFPVAVFFRLRGTNDAEIERLLVMKTSLLQAA